MAEWILFVTTWWNGVPGINYLPRNFIWKFTLFHFISIFYSCVGVCADACARAREGNHIESPIIWGFLMALDWKSDGGTTVPPIFCSLPFPVVFAK